MIKLQDISFQRGTKQLLENTNLTIHTSQKWGIIGANGAGKSTLFKLLLGQLHEDTGSIEIPKNWQISHMAQEVGVSDSCAVDYVIDGDAELREIENQITAAGDDGNKLAKLFDRMEQVDGYTAQPRAEKLLHGLGFKTSDHSRPVSDFSGGWRIRLNLAQALMCRSDLLLLDEPTNHLDLDATLWLEQWLNSYKGTLLIISHDRDFLDNVISHTVNIENLKLVEYVGNYSAYERQKAERLAQQSAAFEKQQTRIAEIENFVRRFRAKATKAKQAQSRLKELERMEKIAPAHIDSPFTFKFPEPEKLPQTLLSLDMADIGYGETPIVSKINFSILSTTRLGLLGHNGAGKSTLIKSLSKEISLLNGERIEASHLKLGYFAQHQLESLDIHASCFLHIRRISPNASEQEIRNFLGGYGFQGDRVFEEIEHFSGGEKARLALAMVAWQKPNLLLLDEPTNHLDLEMRHALTMALQEFEGAIVVVSHDRHLLKNTVDDFLLVDSGKADVFEGNLEDYQKWLLNKPEETNEDTFSSNSSKNRDKKEQRQIAAHNRDKIKPLTNAVKKLEKDLGKLQSKLDVIEKRLLDPQIYEDKLELNKNLKEQAKLKSELDSVEEEWMQKSEELEAFQ